MNYEYELVRGDCIRSITIKSHDYDVVEFTVKQMSWSKDGKRDTDHGHTTFYSKREFKEFFLPLAEDLMKELKDDISNSVQE